jgi:hypothetical protein
VTFTIVAVLLLIVANVLLVKLLLGAVRHPANLVELLDHLEPVNAASFRHLASYSDDHYLRANVSRKDYLHLKHLRLKAVHAYYLSALRNSSLLLAYGEVLAASQHSTFVQFGSEIRSAAMELRMALLRGLFAIWICYFINCEIPSWRHITDLYNQVGSRLSLFCESNFPDLEHAVVEHFWY